MNLNRKLLESISAAAGRITVDHVYIGIGYTAVTTSDDGIGIAATGMALNGSCNGNVDIVDFEGCAASDLLQLIMEAFPMARTMALAPINALNHGQALSMPEDPGNAVLLDRFGIRSGAHVAMVGYFPPLVRLFEEMGVHLSVIDDAKGMGNKNAFYGQLGGWADVLLITATSIIDNSAETILCHAGPALKTVLLGPSTPMVPKALAGLPIDMLAGSAVTEPRQALKIIRHGGGTRALKPFMCKVYWLAA